MAVAAGLFMGGASGAVAASWTTIPHQYTGGAEFRGGQYVFEPKGRNHGGFHLKGDLADIEPGDGHNVYLEVKVEGYDWNRLKGTQKKTVHIDKVVYDGQAQYTSDAWLHLCRDRGSLRPDNCTTTLYFHREGNGTS
ncbi:hypothetical protein ACIGO8_13500 [Streptomyces sp. NPDC053493]|uniref:hypothetical protein n=1 Tax=Streptomyces sp. NPDC053493 TaxID=3365705 RepID=UPI0037D12A36